MKFVLLGILWTNVVVLSFEGFSSPNLEIMEIPPYCTINDSSNKNVNLLPEDKSLSADAKQEGELEEKNYVVIGVFALKSNAIKFSEYAENNSFPSKFSQNPTNNFYYVYLFSSTKVEEAKAERVKIMDRTNLFPGIWIFKYKKELLGSDPHVIAQTEEKGIVESNGLIQTEINERNLTAIDRSVEEAAEVEKKENGYFIYPNVVDARNYKEIKSSVEVVDPSRAKLVETLEAHKLSLVKDPNNSNHAIRLIAKSFGYRNVVHDLLLTQLNEDSISAYVDIREDTILVDFPMVRLKTGDVATMYSVFFQNDAAVMLSDSKYQLNSLLEMLKENLNYKIRIHGHTNGNRRGRIIELQKENPDFFTISEENKRGNGSARKLSEERALTIKRYLVINGISADRMEVKGWGGKKMIFDKNSIDAKKNVRVEIEILQD